MVVKHIVGTRDEKLLAKVLRVKYILILHVITILNASIKTHNYTL